MSFLRALQTPLLPAILISSVFTYHTRRPLSNDAPPPPGPPTLFPPTIVSPHSTRLTLVAQGIRTVSIFRIKVYDVGLYADLREPLPFSDVGKGEERKAGERMKELLEGREVVLRIVPSRKTSFTHMRDGFIRALNHRLSLRTEPPTDSLKSALSHVSSLFPNTPLPASTVLTLSYHPPTTSLFGPSQRQDPYLILDYEGRRLGEVRDAWVSREWVMSYFDEAREISRELRERTEKRLNELVMQSAGKALVA